MADEEASSEKPNEELIRALEQRVAGTPEIPLTIEPKDLRTGDVIAWSQEDSAKKNIRCYGLVVGNNNQRIFVKTPYVEKFQRLSYSWMKDSFSLVLRCNKKQSDELSKAFGFNIIAQNEESQHKAGNMLTHYF